MQLAAKATSPSPRNLGFSSAFSLHKTPFSDDLSYWSLASWLAMPHPLYIHASHTHTHAYELRKHHSSPFNSSHAYVSQPNIYNASTPLRHKKIKENKGVASPPSPFYSLSLSFPLTTISFPFSSFPPLFILLLLLLLLSLYQLTHHHAGQSSSSSDIVSLFSQAAQLS